MRHYYYLNEVPLAARHAGNKARVDIDRVFSLMGLEVLKGVEQVKLDSLLEKLLYKANPKYLLKLLKIVFHTNKIVFVQYPFYYDFVTKWILKHFVKHNRTILIIHDVDALRNLGSIKLEEEIGFLNSTTCLITHNVHMTKQLQNLGVTTPMVELELFDYLLNAPYPELNRSLSSEIAFAGNLEKSTFLQEKQFAELSLKFSLYGVNYSKDFIPWENVNYKGSFKPDEIPYVLDGSFGLIWDGTTIESCTGSYGNYLKFNNPHKLSLYVAAGLPVISWSQAAISDFIEKYQIGFCVDSLTDVQNVIESLTEEEYQLYVNNIRQLQKKVVDGQFTQEAIKKVIASL